MTTQPMEIFTVTKWRLIFSQPAKGAWNMAVDEALLEGMAQADAQAVLRLYAWNPPCLSLGYAQPFSDVELQALQRYGWELVRRPTGGRAILHTDELTYAVIAPHSEPRMAGSVLESYQRVSMALLEALRRLNLPAEAQEKKQIKPGSNPNGAVCFEVPSNYEITVNGLKLIGSAQARKREGVLQHGSLPLYGDLSRITQALAFYDADGNKDESQREQAAQRLLRRATTVESSLGRRISWEQAAEAFVKAFETILNLQFSPSELTPAELQRAEALMAEKYASELWNKRVA